MASILHQGKSIVMQYTIYHMVNSKFHSNGIKKKWKLKFKANYLFERSKIVIFEFVILLRKMLFKLARNIQHIAT